MVFKVPFCYGRTLKAENAASPKRACFSNLKISFFVTPPHFSTDRRVQVLQKAWNPLSDDLKAI
jgi:hypothetical protein